MRRVLDEPAPTIAVGELGNSAVNLLVRPWCSKDVYWDLRWDLTRALKEELERAGCTIPSSGMTGIFGQDSGRQRAARSTCPAQPAFMSKGVEHALKRRNRSRRSYPYPFSVSSLRRYADQD